MPHCGRIERESGERELCIVGGRGKVNPAQGPGRPKQGRWAWRKATGVDGC